MPYPKKLASFQDQLVADERILWEGSPSISFLHYLRLEIVRPITIVYIVIILFVIGFLSPGKSGATSMMALLLTGLFMGIGLIVLIPYTLFYYYREYRRYGIGIYAVTDKRILVSSKSGMTSIPINTIPGIVKLDNKNGLGTIQFQVQGFPILYRIEDADTVYKLINDLRAKSA